MKIKSIKLGIIKIPLRRPFKTALRTVYNVEDVVVRIETESGLVGYGEAPPTGVITGDTTGAIIGAINDHISKAIMGMDIRNYEDIMIVLNKSLVHNSSAKAAVDIAIHDLYAQSFNRPLYRLLGGSKTEIETDITISVNSPEEMVEDSLSAVSEGYRTLKIKVGKDSALDIERIKAIRKAIGYDINIRIDANQGWSAKEAIRTIRKMEDEDLRLELVEQPVPAYDIKGLKLVTDNVDVPILADESVFSPMDAMNIINTGAADLINIKLMKTGGIYNAIKIADMASLYNVECMIGCMLESKLSVTAAVHLAAAKGIITKVDLDGPVLLKEDPIIGGALFNYAKISIDDSIGLGFKQVNGVEYF